MDFSHNKNQLYIFWPVLFDKNEMNTPNWYNSPRLALKYWCICYKRVLEEAKTMGNNFYLLDYDKLTKEPAIEIKKLLKFLDISYNQHMITILASSVRESEGVGRFRTHDLSQFDREDMEFVKSMGYPIE